MKKIDFIVGARPNFIKIAALLNYFKNNVSVKKNYSYRLIHTGQHYDKKMSKNFFEELNIPEPDINFGVGSGTQSSQTAKIMIEYEKLLTKKNTDLCIVVGDVTSTMACSIVAKKCNVPVAHVEAGLRSYDWEMPEEINRVVTDSISDIYFTTSRIASDYLRSIGVDDNKISFVGNTMIDTLINNFDRLREPLFFKEKQLNFKKYFCLTLHRPSNVDDLKKLSNIIKTISEAASENRIIFPMHPRTKKVISKSDLNKYKNIIIVDPMSYLEFIYLIKNSSAIITDSGGITEEATYLKIPCITLRNSTERPETITMGSNVLVGDDPRNISKYIQLVIDNKWKVSTIPEKWDGFAASRIFNKIDKFLF